MGKSAIGRGLTPFLDLFVDRCSQILALASGIHPPQIAIVQQQQAVLAQPDQIWRLAWKRGSQVARCRPVEQIPVTPRPVVVSVEALRIREHRPPPPATGRTPPHPT